MADPGGTGKVHTVWARVERVPSTQENGLLGIMRKGSKACDIIKFSYRGAFLRGSKDDLTMQLRCYRVKVIHVAHLFSLIHQHSTVYYAGSFNCWWFAAGLSAIPCT